MRRSRIVGSAVLSFVLLAGAAAPPQQAVNTRKAGFKALGSSFKSVNDLLRADNPDRRLLEQKVREIGVAARRVPRWFPAGTGPSDTVRTRAKTEIWTDPARFRAAAAALTVEADRLGAIVRRGDLAAARAQTRLVGQTCAGCHSPFRAKD